MKRVTPELLQSEISKLNAKIELEYTALFEKESKRNENRINEMQKSFQDIKNKQREKNNELEERLDKIGSPEDELLFDGPP